MRNYHVVLVDSERNVKATDARVDVGCLLFFNNLEVILAYAAGQWKYVEVERLDDK